MGEQSTSPGAAASAITMHDVRHVFEPEVGVFDLNLDVPNGTIFGFIGPSGSGKTTTVRLILGLHGVDEGEVRVLGADPRHFPPAIRARIGYMPQSFVLYQNLTVAENLGFAASLYGLGYRERKKPIAEALALVELADVPKRLARELSGGMQRRLELACALVHHPQLLIADEPTAGIDPLLRRKFWDHFTSLRDAGGTLVVTTQYVGEAAYCDQVGVLREGRLIAVDSPAALRRRALGGEVIRLLVAPQQVYRVAQVLQSQPMISRTTVDPATPGQILAYVEQAAVSLPEVLAAIQALGDVEILEAGDYQPPFDDVFVRLLEQSEAQDA